MTDLEKLESERAAIKQRETEAVETANALTQQRAQAMQEIVRLAGELRLCERWIAAAKK